MVKIIHLNLKDSPPKEFFQCGECGLKYEDEEWAEKCEKWCSEHKSCNLEIIKHAVKE